MIIVPYNFSKQSLFALEEAYTLAKASKSAITLVYVIENNALFKKIDKKIIQQVIKGFDVELKEIINSQKEKSEGIKISTSIRKGRIFSEILKATKELNAKWIVTGLNNRTKENEREYIGANTFRLLKTATVPVITVSGKSEHSFYKNILLPLDSSAETMQKVNGAIKIAKLFNSTIHVVSMQKGKRDVLDYKHQIQTNQVCEKINKAGLVCNTKSINDVENKKIIEKLVKYSNEKEINLVITMTEEEIAAKPFFVSSRTQNFMRKFEIPVMTQKPKVLGRISFR